MQSRYCGSMALFTGMAFVLSSTFAHSLGAQACFGSPAERGQSYVGVGVGLADGSTSFSLNGGANLAGPAAVGGWVGMASVDNVTGNVTGAGGQISFDLPTEGPSACISAGTEYQSWTDRYQGAEIKLTVVSIPFSLSVGHRAELDGNAAFIPWVGAGMLHQRGKATARYGGTSYTENGSESEFFVHGGGTLALGAFFVHGRASKTTFEGAEVTLGLGVGLVF